MRSKEQAMSGYSIISRTAALAMLGCALFVPAAAWAQRSTQGSNRGGTTTNGMFGATTFGANAGSTGTGAGGGTSIGSSATGQGAQSAVGLGAQMGQPAQLERPGFVGSSSETVTNVRSAQATGAAGRGSNARGGQNFGGLQGLFSQLEQNNFNQGGQQGQPRVPLTIPIRLGFQPRPVASTQFTSRFEGRLAKLPGLKAVGPMEVTLEGRTAVLRGTVASEADRQLAEGLARLEPEVLEVRNELVVGSLETTGPILNSSSAREF
jgi:hypothetical protein